LGLRLKFKALREALDYVEDDPVRRTDGISDRHDVIESKTQVKVPTREDGWREGKKLQVLWEVILKIMDMLFGCWHKRTSFPISKVQGRRVPAAREAGAYVVCLDCGKEFSYDWQKMRIVAPREFEPTTDPLMLQTSTKAIEANV